MLLMMMSVLMIVVWVVVMMMVVMVLYIVLFFVIDGVVLVCIVVFVAIDYDDYDADKNDDADWHTIAADNFNVTVSSVEDDVGDLVNDNDDIDDDEYLFFGND